MAGKVTTAKTNIGNVTYNTLATDKGSVDTAVKDVLDNDHENATGIKSAIKSDENYLTDAKTTIESLNVLKGIDPAASKGSVESEISGAGLNANIVTEVAIDENNTTATVTISVIDANGSSAESVNAMITLS